MSIASLISTKFLILLQLVSFPVICVLPLAKRNMFLTTLILVLQVIASSIMLFGNFTAGELFGVIAPSVALFFHGYILNQLNNSNENGSVDMEFLLPPFYIITLPAAFFVEVVATRYILN